MSIFDRPAFPPINLDDADLARLGFVSACEARTKAALVWSLKALEAASLDEMPRYQRLSIGELLKRIEVRSDSLSENTLKALVEVSALHQPTQLIRNRLIHGVWGSGVDDAAIMLDMRRHEAFESEHLQHGVTLNAEFARACHNFLMELARDIREGRVVPAPTEGCGMAVRLAEGLVYF
jgi:hypothetical protein